MLILCNCKYLRIDEFFSLEYDELKPKLFKNENPGLFYYFFLQKFKLIIDL